jgi:hypothetical protein
VKNMARWGKYVVAAIPEKAGAGENVETRLRRKEIRAQAWG